jgi:dihydroneopterin aldolase
MKMRQLDIVNYEIYVILGNDDCERKDRRRIIADISLRFTDKNDACRSDDLGETVCYANLMDFLEEKLRHTQFHLLERITQFLYDEISVYLGNKTDVLKYVRVTKIDPPVENLKSASFICSDW